MTRMTLEEFRVAATRNGLPLDAAKKDELYRAFSNLEVMIDLITLAKRREIDPALVLAPGRVR